MSKVKNNQEALRALPSVDSLLKTDTARALSKEVGAAKLTSLARFAAEDLRKKLLSAAIAPENVVDSTRSELLKQAEHLLLKLHQAENANGIRRVINATGVVLHTNLGRAPLSDQARRAIVEASGYCTLEYDVGAGSRGRRGARVEQLLVDLTGAEAALVVNNCAAAALLVLATFSRDGETIVSRGELVEIGGDFRVPEIMAQSGAHMVEVGTTNRTHRSDYQNAISTNSRVVMRVHTSNYRIVGFTDTPSLSELAELTHAAGLLLYEDAGSGALIDFSQFGIEGEPVIKQSIAAGADIVSFSGDKLLGGPQAGLLVGRAELIERMRKNSLYRALRADKLRLAALEATLAAYLRDEQVATVQMIAMTSDQIRNRAKKLLVRINEDLPDHVSLKLVEGQSAVGGGSAPTSPLPTTLISITDTTRTANQLEAALRNFDPPILVRMVDASVVIDLRSVPEAEEPELEAAIKGLN